MKRIYQIASTLMLCAMLSSSMQPRAYAQDVVVSYQTFYDELSPYGQWVADPVYGNVWIPNVEEGFRPYATEGHWAMTDYGNMWVSDAPWGWAAYHYGRWTYNSYYGWVWVPGHEWAPAWVSWRQGGGYYGWAPMAPDHIPGRYYDYPDNYWVFVGPQYLYHPRVYTYYKPRNTNIYISHTSYVNESYVDNGSHVSYYYGPRREVIERESHQRVPVYNVSNASAPGSAHVNNNSVSIYRPAVNSQSATSVHPTSVMNSTRPIGKPESYDAGHNHNEFHQQLRTQSPMSQQHQAVPQQQEPSRQPQTMPQQQPMPQQRQPMQPQHQPMQEQPRQQMQPQRQPMQEQPRQQMQPQRQPMQEQPRQQMQPQRQPTQEQPRQQMQPQQHQQPMPQQHQQPAPQQRPQPQRQSPAPAAPTHDVKKR